MRQIFEVFDNGIGDGDSRALGFFISRSLAEEVAKNKGGMGGGSGTIEIHYLFESISEYQDFTAGEIRKRALAKLSRAEKISLGISPDA
jgi:hypothetical protein